MRILHIRIESFEPALSHKTVAVGLWLLLFVLFGKGVLDPLRQKLLSKTGAATGFGPAEQPQAIIPSALQDSDGGIADEIPSDQAILEALTPESMYEDPGEDEVCDLLGCNSKSDTSPIDPEGLLSNLPPIEDPLGTGLSNFMQALSRLDKERSGTVRIAHFGDSLIVGDWLTQTTRSLLQEHFGDSGMGFTLPAKAWPWYMRNSLSLGGSDTSIFRVMGPTLKDRRYGLGGVASVAKAGASLWYAFSKKTTDTVTLEIQFLAEPKAGVFHVRADSQELAQVDAAAEEASAKYQSIELPAQTNKVEVVVERGSVRFFGLTFEGSQPGIVYDSLGMNGATAAHLTMQDESLWSEQLAHRSYDLVILAFGLNESYWTDLNLAWYEGKLRTAIRQIKQALPQASCLVMSPMDRPVQGAHGWESAPTLSSLILLQRKVALTEGCGFFNTFLAMGGMGSFGRWLAAKPKLAGSDYMHPTAAGAHLLGRMLFSTLMNQYEMLE